MNQLRLMVFNCLFGLLPLAFGCAPIEADRWGSGVFYTQRYPEIRQEHRIFESHYYYPPAYSYDRIPHQTRQEARKIWDARKEIDADKREIRRDQKELRRDTMESRADKRELRKDIRRGASPVEIARDRREIRKDIDEIAEDRRRLQQDRTELQTDERKLYR
jgi:hypothetical protein